MKAVDYFFYGEVVDAPFPFVELPFIP